MSKLWSFGSYPTKSFVRKLRDTVQTFLPYADFRESAKCLDRKRLGKQRVECKQLLSGQWPNHPASVMWRGCELCLVLYTAEICTEWLRRGYEDNILAWLKIWLKENYGMTLRELAEHPPEKPYWLGNLYFHLCHQSNLLRKSPEHYRKHFGPSIPDDMDYWWPPQRKG